MDIGHFYFLNSTYYKDFPDPYLMQDLDRPCFYAFKDAKTGIYWMIPFSSRVAKFRGIYQNKVRKYGACDTIDFGEVLGYEKAFLIQNMCPVTDEYVLNEYVDHSANVPVRLNGAFEQRLIKKAAKVLALQRKGYRLIFPDVLKIEKELIEKMPKGQEQG